MATKNSKSFGIGVLLALSFAAVLVLIFLPLFGAGKDGKAMNGLDYADDLFNKLSKGSSYFVKKLQGAASKYEGRAFSASVSLEKAEDAAFAAQVFTAAGATAEASDKSLKVSGDLGKVLGAVLADADAMYYNRGAEVAARYEGAKEKAVLRTWWTVFSKIDKNLKKEGKIEESKIISDVMKKAVETAYNYYGIEPVKVAEKAFLMTFLLVFYVAYTMWWGFAIFYIFEGVGLTMKKAKVKKEA